MEEPPSVPRIVVMLVCMAVAEDPEPLLSLSARLRTLGALSQTDRDTRDIVRRMAMPLLIEAFVPVADRHRHGKAHVPSVESLVHRSDQKVDRMQHDLCCVPTRMPAIEMHARRATVNRILETARSFWHLVPLKRELRRRCNEVMTTKRACAEFRLRRADLATSPTMRREDLLGVALARHGSAAALAKLDASMRASVARRVEARGLNAGRREDLEAASGNPADWRMLLAVRVELVEAVRAFARTGHSSKRAAALAVFACDMTGVAARRAEVDALPWDNRRLSPAMQHARDEYVLYAGDADIEALVRAATTVHRTTTNAPRQLVRTHVY
jgi:hypothetical protein